MIPFETVQKKLCLSVSVCDSVLNSVFDSLTSKYEVLLVFVSLFVCLFLNINSVI